jgi:hypothetical protein
LTGFLGADFLADVLVFASTDAAVFNLFVIFPSGFFLLAAFLASACFLGFTAALTGATLALAFCLVFGFEILALILGLAFAVVVAFAFGLKAALVAASAFCFTTGFFFAAALVFTAALVVALVLLAATLVDGFTLALVFAFVAGAFLRFAAISVVQFDRSRKTRSFLTGRTVPELDGFAKSYQI